MARGNGKSNGHRTIGVYRAYNFRTKDPAIDALRNLAEEHYGRRLTGRELTQITEDGGPSVGCMRGWFFGATKRPTNPTIEAAGRAMGYERVWRRMRRNRPED
jgi:hypothetical protein